MENSQVVTILQFFASYAKSMLFSLNFTWNETCFEPVWKGSNSCKYVNTYFFGF